jgi:NTE family protein
VLRVLLPRLAAAGIRPTLFVGTSAGAIKATLYAAVAQLPADEQAEVVLDVWRNLHTTSVFKSPVFTGVGTTSRWAGQLLRVPGARVVQPAGRQFVVADRARRRGLGAAADEPRRPAGGWRS